MKDYASLRKKHNASRTIAIIMAVLVVIEMCSLTILFSRVNGFFGSGADYTISLTEGAEQSALVKYDTANTGFIVPTYVADPDVYFIEAEDDVNEKDIGFRTFDDDQTWLTDVYQTITDIEVFHLTYDKDRDELTVISSDDSKVFAPGTSETYRFAVENTGKCPLRYLVYLEAWIDAKDGNGQDLWIPLYSRFRNEEGTFFSSTYTDSEWHDYPHIDKTGEIRPLAQGANFNYYVDWEWPFERFDGEGLDANDAYDTMLGNLAAAGSDLRAYIRIKTVAWAECPEPTETVAPSETVIPTETTAPTTPVPTETTAPTTPVPTETTAPTTPAPTETTAPTTPVPTETTAPTTPAPTETTAPTTPAPTTPAPTETTAPTTPAPTTPAPTETTAPTTPAPTETTAPTTPAPTEEPTGEPGTEPVVTPTQAPTSIVTPTQAPTVAPTTTPVTPKTGDMTNNILWIILAVSALAALIVLFIVYRKVRKREKADN